MRRILYSIVALLLSPLAAIAQNVICATAPPGDSSNRCASTAFVQGAISDNILASNNTWTGINIFSGNPLTITAASSAVLPALSTAALKIIDTSTSTQQSGPEIQLGNIASDPWAIIRANLITGPSPYRGDLTFNLRQADGVMTEHLRLLAGGSLRSGAAHPLVGGPYNFGAYNKYGFQNFIGYTETASCAPNCAAISGYFVSANNHTNGSGEAAWGIYAEGQAHNQQFTLGAEIDVQNASGMAPRTIDPNNIFGSGPGPVAVAIWSQANGVSTVDPILDASAHIATVWSNYQGNPKFQKGWVIQAGAIASVNGRMEAVALPANNEFVWYNSGGTSVTRLFGDGTNLTAVSQTTFLRAANATQTSLTIGSDATGDRSARLYFGASSGGSNTDATLHRVGGANGQFQISNQGTGAFALILNSSNAITVSGSTLDANFLGTGDTTSTTTGALRTTGGGAFAKGLNVGTFTQVGSYMRVGGNAAPANTTAGDLTFVRGFASSLDISGSSASVLPGLSSVALNLVNTNTTANSGSDITFATVAGSPFAVIRGTLRTGPSPYYGDMVFATKQTTDNVLTDHLRLYPYGSLRSGPTHSMIQGTYNFGAYNKYGYQNFIGYTETSACSPTCGGTQSGYFVAANNHVSGETQTAWGLYAEGQAYNQQLVHGAEIDVQNVSGMAARNTNPYLPFGSGPGPVAVAIWSQPNGVNPSGTIWDSSAHLVTVANPNQGNPRFLKGWVIHDQAIREVSGRSEIIATYQNTDISWYNSNGTDVASLRSDGVRFEFSDGGTFTGTFATGVGSAPHLLVQASGAASPVWSTAGTVIGVNAPSGYTGRLADFYVNGSRALTFAYEGSITTGSTSSFIFGGRSQINSAADGVLKISNQASTDFNRLQFGGTTSAFPSIKRVGAALVSRLADDSANALFSASRLQTDSNTVGSLGVCDAAVRGTRSFVTDASATTFASIVAGGGANNLPVVCNGTNWIIG